MFYILHITDIHFGSIGNSASKRLQQLIKAIVSRTNKDSDILIAMTGDIAYSGLAEQYNEASQFVLSLKERLRERGCAVNICVAPGNHDCDLGNAKQVRDTLLANRDLPVGDDVVSILEQPQQAFRDFVNAISAPTVRNHSSNEHRLTASDSKQIFVQTINTALYSKLGQSPGTLFVPSSEFTQETPEADLHVTLMHHPVGWLDSNQSSQIRNSLSETTDIILTGHEHTGFAQELANLDTNANQLHIEGIALQGDDPEDSGFYIVCVDTNARRYSTIRFVWKSNRYEVGAESELRPFRCNRRRSRDYSFTTDHHLFLNDLGVALGHPEGDAHLTLDDVFVYPDLQDPTSEQNSGLRTIKAEDLCAAVQTSYFTVITGPERSGKTCLAKRLSRDLAAVRLFPVYFDEVPQQQSFDRRHLAKQYSRQYSFPDSETYLQAESSKRVVILDDSFLREPLGLERALRSIRDFADHVILLTSDAFHQIVTTVVAGSEIAAGRVLRLLPFGHARRGHLVERWLSLLSTGQDGAAYEREHLHRMQFLTNVVGRNLVPAFPVVLLSLLKANDQNQQPDLTRSGFSYYYDFLIRQQLTLGQSKNRDVDVTTSFLSELALEFLRKNLREISDADLRKFTEAFEKEKILTLDYSNIVGWLDKSKLLVRNREGNFRFAYDWARYYFVARQIATMLGMDATVDVAKELIAKLQVSIDAEESGNILLFLAYFSKHQFLFDSLRDQADRMYASEPELGVGYDTSLSGDLAVAEALKLLDPVYQDVEPSLVRIELLEQRDRVEAERRKELEAEFARVDRVVAEFFASVRVVQLLGQLLKNNPASIPGEQKLLVAKSCHRLAFRALGFFSKLLAENQQPLVAAFIAPLVSDGHVTSIAKLEQEARKSLHVLRYLATQSTVRRVANALADFSLVPLADRVAEELKSPASELVAVAVRLGLLEAEFPRAPVMKTYEKLSTNPMGQAILRRLVATRLYLYDTGHEERQRICAHLNINMKALPQPRRRGE